MITRTISVLLVAMLAMGPVLLPVLAKEKVTPPVLLEKTDPKYPADAKDEKIQGTVKIQAVIDETGKVSEASATESPDPRLSQAAVDAVKQWKFKPAEAAGKPVKAKSTITVNFRLK